MNRGSKSDYDLAAIGRTQNATEGIAHKLPLPRSGEGGEGVQQTNARSLLRYG